MKIFDNSEFSVEIIVYFLRREESKTVSQKFKLPLYYQI